MSYLYNLSGYDPIMAHDAIEDDTWFWLNKRREKIYIILFCKIDLDE